MVSKYTTPDYDNGELDDILDYGQFGRCIYKSNMKWDSSVKRMDRILYNESEHRMELDKDLRFGSAVDSATRAAVTNIIKKYWDCFVKNGAKRTIIGYEFGIDTSGAKPVCCRKPSYGPYESKIIMSQIEDLLGNKWIEECGGPWGSMIVLAQKPHQEHINNIEDFIWRMCVSYRKLNSVTKPFQFPIPRCDDAIMIMGWGAGKIFIISLDARQGYHQVSVRKVDREKLAFFAPNDRKYCFNVMPFGPTNAPSFYTAMMKNFKDEWDALFSQTVLALGTFEDEQITLSAAQELLIGSRKLISGSKVIIDDIILWCDIKLLLLTYFDCVCQVFLKYRVSFRLDKCEFLKPRVEYVGHDILPSGNSPASSKFSMINDWPLPTTGQSLFSFIGLVNFYHRYAPYMELRLKPLRKLVKAHYRRPIPNANWTPELTKLFFDLKICITSSPVLARFDPGMPTFLKTDWSSAGMGWILMQPNDDNESIAATKLLRDTGECKFELTKNGARLKPIAFGSRACRDNEVNFHSFTGEAASGRWAISQNRNYLWGNHFYWMCDCSAVKEVLEYNGSIPMICRWAQELLGYNFTCIHRSARMMVDVDALTRRFGSLITTHCVIAHIFRVQDHKYKPVSCDANTFHSHSTSKLADAITASPLVPILSSTVVNVHCKLHPVGMPSDMIKYKPNELPTAGLPNNKERLSNIHRANTAAAPSMPLTTTPVPTPMAITPSIAVPLPVAPSTSPSAPSSSIALHMPVAPSASSNDLSISSSPIMYIAQHRPIATQDIGRTQAPAMRATELCHSLFSECWCINDICGSMIFWATDNPALGIRWNHKFILTNSSYRSLSQHLHPSEPSILSTLGTLTPDPDCSIIIVTYINNNIDSIFSWFHNVGTLLNAAMKFSSNFNLGLLWLRSDQFHDSVRSACLPIIQSVIPDDWCVTQHLINASDYGDAIDALRCLIVISHHIPVVDVSTLVVGAVTDAAQSSFSHCIMKNAHATIVHTNIPFPRHEPQQRDNIKAHVIAAFRPDTQQDLSSMASPNYVLDPGYPALEPAPKEYANNLFGRRFGVPCDDTNTFCARALNNVELLLCYSVPLLSINTYIQETEYLTTWLDDYMRYAIPIKSFALVLSYLVEATGFLETLVYGSDHADAHQFYKISASPTSIDWKAAYMEDISTKIMLPMLQRNENPTWSEDELASLEVEYRAFLKERHIGILHDKLVYYKPIFRDSRHIALIIVPKLLRRMIFSHYHAGPSGGHMGEYKTLYRIRMRFYWPSMRADIKNWVKSCAHCCAYDVWQNRKSELYFSWPVTTPFYIMHVDLWAPGHLVDQDGRTLQSMNSMCDLTQFVVSSLVEDATSTVLAKLFMEDVVLNFGIVAVVVVDADSKFLGTFKDMCSILKIQFWPLARGNHKGNSVERYHRFLNKTQAIIGQDRGTHSSFRQNMKTSQYAWNSAPIDDTDIPRCLPAVGRIFKFPMDVELESIPTLNCSDNSALYIYLRDVSNESAFATSVLQVLIEERRASHRARWNKNRSEQIFQVGDVVKAHVQVQSNASTGVVKKLSYQARGPFRVTRILGANSYEVQRYNSPSSAPRKYKGTELYILPPNLFPSEPMDTMDERYLNSEHAPMVSPLHRPLKIELYNDTYFPPTSAKLQESMVDKPSCLVDNHVESPVLIPVKELEAMPRTDKIFDESGNSLPAIEHSDITDYRTIPSALNLDAKLFFVQFNPEDTMRRLWYVVQVDMPSTIEVNPDYASNGQFWCVFHFKHPSDTKLSDACSRWWPEWYKYSRDPVSNNIIYGERILVQPSVTPSDKKFIQWAALLPLYGPESTVLVGPFLFAPIDESNRIRQKIASCEWIVLAQICNNIGILPPSIEPIPAPRAASKKKRKRN